MSKKKSSKTAPWSARQGDVLIVAIDEAEIPSSAKPVPRENGAAILAHGEATGHHHAFHRTGVDLVRDEAAGRFLRVGGTSGKTSRAAADAINTKIAALFGRSDLPEPRRKADVEEIVAKAELAGYAALRHNGSDGKQADHKPIVVAPGAYRVIQQLEYTPDEIRQVAD